MSDDIVTRLRQEWEYGNNAKGCDYEMFAQAADEIERLQNRLEKFERAAWELSMYGVFTDSSLGRKALITYTEAVRGE